MLRKVLMVCLTAAILPMTAANAQKATQTGTTDDVRALEKTFGEIDRNGNGSVTRLEMSAYGHGRGYGVVKSKGWKRMDTDGNGTISRDEFVREMIRFHNARSTRRR